MAKARDVLDADTDDLVRVTKALASSGNHPLRERTAQATYDSLQADLAKLGGLQPLKYPSGQGENVLQSNRSINPNVERFPDRSQHTTLDAVVNPKPSQFEAKVQQIATERGISRFAAMTRARIENPSLYWAFVNGNASEPVQAQQERETRYQVEKSAPSYEQLVEAEMAKGCNQTVAMQRLAHIGICPGEEIVAKANDDYFQFREAAQERLVEGGAMPRTSAMRAARYEMPELYKSLSGRR